MGRKDSVFGEEDEEDLGNMRKGIWGRGGRSSCRERIQASHAHNGSSPPSPSRSSYNPLRAVAAAWERALVS
nr:unnamed protein product [Digitaria exilis]